MTEPRSGKAGRFYSVVTHRWPQIAAVLVAAIGVSELVFGGLTADSALEFYLTAWAAATGGLWFLFQKAETALSEASRDSVASYILSGARERAVESLPDQFAGLFDRVFGERPLSVSCFLRSALASIATLFCLSLAAAGLAGHPLLVPGVGDTPWRFVGFVIAVGALVNVVPDYVSLLETRWAIGVLRRTQRVAVVLLVDAALTALIAVTFVATALLIFLIAARMAGGADPNTSLGRMIASGVLSAATNITDARLGTGPGVFFYSTFFTSAWLWIYAASLPIARILLKMNAGFGWLLRATDVKEQPFRSLGFVGVLVVSAVFTLGLPFVLFR